MNTQKWMLVVSIILFLGAAGLVAFSLLTPYAWAQGPMGWDGRGGGGFGPGGMGRGMMGGQFDSDFGPGAGRGMMGGGMMGGRWGGPKNSLITVAAEKLGLTTQELLTELQAGKTIADVAAEKNVAVDTIVEAVLADRTELLNERVANGQITQEQAETMLTLMKSHITEEINEAWSPRGFGPGMMGDQFGSGFGPGAGRGMMGGGMMGGRWGGPGQEGMTTVADTLGLTPAELAAELQGGKSVADVAAGKNVELATIVKAVLAPRTERLNELVTEGQLTQAEVEARLSNLKVDLVERLYQSWGFQYGAPAAGTDEPGSN